MKLISTFSFSNALKATAVILMMLLASLSYSRTVTQNNVPPVFWNIFNAEASNRTIVLTWTVTEYNNKKFYIQHSLNGNDWKNVDSIESKKSLESLEDYSFTYINAGKGRQYYRIKQVDIDINKTGYSKVLSVMLTNNDKQNITVWPNPASNEVRIMNNGSDNFYTHAKIFDLSGKIVAEKKLQPHTNSISISELPTGAYIVRLEGANGIIYNQKIVKQ